MTKYERYTSKDGATLTMSQWGGSPAELELYRKLADLEDKIEQGTLVELQNEWISVEERLPETDNENTHTHNVLVYIPQREGCCQHGIFLGKLKEVKADDGSGNFWGVETEASAWTVWGWSYFEHPIVTHWKPIPTPPEAEAKLRELKGERE